MVALYKDPQGKNVFQRVAVTTHVGSSGITGTNTNITSTAIDKEEGDSELTILRERVTQLEAKLKIHEEREDKQ